VVGVVETTVNLVAGRLVDQEAVVQDHRQHPTQVVLELQGKVMLAEMDITVHQTMGAVAVAVLVLRESVEHLQPVATAVLG
jgi:hypothetical protein